MSPGPAGRWRAWRRARRQARETLFHASHARGLREDLASRESLDALAEAEARVREALRRRDPAALGEATGRLGERARAVCPPRPFARWRDRVETVVIAAAVAMGVRTYFVQPFKIPTGSMQPTLHGITVRAQEGRRWYDWPPLGWAGWALFGEGYVEVRARAAGYLSGERQTEEGRVVFVGRIPHRVRGNMPLRVAPGDPVARGDVLASGRVQMGDHLFVNKIRYHFARPRRGEVVVFDTARVRHPAIRDDSFYIKRLAGLPGEHLAIDPPHLVVDGRRIANPEPFRRQVEDARYAGYLLAPDLPGGPRPALGTPGAGLRLGPGEYLPLGDNTASSLDGRYFGPIPAESLVGPAFWVYWPFTRRWGPVR